MPIPQTEPPRPVSALTIALAKGRILDETLPLFAHAGIVPVEDPDTSRKLILPTNRPGISFVIVRPTDVPTYVQYGAADAGIVGKDVLLEHGGEGLYQPLDLGIGRCRLVVATMRSYDWAGTVQRGARIRVATKYVRTAREHFAAKGMHVDLIKLYGSMELGAARRTRGRHRRPRVDGQHAEGQRPRRRRGHHDDHVAARRPSRRSEAEARADAAADRRARGRDARRQGGCRKLCGTGHETSHASRNG